MNQVAGYRGEVGDCMGQVAGCRDLGLERSCEAAGYKDPETDAGLEFVGLQ